MAIKSGLAAQLGVIDESTYGTAVTVSRFYPFISESMKNSIDHIDSKGIIAGRRVLDSTQWVPGDIKVSGSIQAELYDHTMGFWLRQMFGGYSVTGAGPYTQTYTPGDLTGKSFTMQIGRPSVAAGVVQPFTYNGCKVTKWQIGAQAGQIATLGIDVVAQNETTGTALATASFGTLNPVSYVAGTFTVGGSTVPVKQVTISGDNKLDDSRRFVGSQTISEPLEIALREYKIDFLPEFTDLTLHTRFTAGTVGALVFSLASGANTYTFTCNVRFDASDPVVSGTKIVENPIKAVAIGTTDAAAITLVSVNSDSVY